MRLVRRLTLPIACATMFAVITIDLVNAPATRAQSIDSEPSFEVASIRPRISDSRSTGISTSGTRVTVEAMTLRDLVSYAYRLKDHQISGGPSWSNSDRWDIVAKAEGDRALAAQQVRPMMQTLLADRFRMKSHYERRTMSVYALVEAKGGAKLKKSDPDSTNGMNLRGGGAIHITATAGTLEQLADQLAGNLQRPVVNQTGLTGKYDYELEWAPESAAAADLNAPSVFTALTEQLGLKLEARKPEIQVLVIDYAEKPSEN